MRWQPEDPPILLLDGSGQSRTVWRAAAEALVAAGRRIVNLDLRGHGGSEWPADGRYDIDALPKICAASSPGSTPGR